MGIIDSQKGDKEVASIGSSGFPSLGNPVRWLMAVGALAALLYVSVTAYGSFAFAQASVPDVVPRVKSWDGDEKAVIGWGEPNNGGSPITGFEFRKRVAANEWEEDAWEDTRGGGYYFYIIEGLSNGTDYDIQVRAVNAIGAGPASDTVTVSPVAPTETLTPPSGIGLHLADVDSIKFTYTPPNDLMVGDETHVQYWENSSSSTEREIRKFTYNPYSHGSLNLLTKITGLKPETEYNFRVRFENRLGAGEWSDEATFQTASVLDVVPNAPVRSSWITNSDDKMIGIDYRWDMVTWGENNTPMARYQVQSTYPEARFEGDSLISSNEHRVSIDSNAGGRVVVRVRGHTRLPDNGVANSVTEWSPWVEFVYDPANTDYAPSHTIKGLSAQRNGDRVTLEWQPVDGNTGYRYRLNFIEPYRDLAAGTTTVEIENAPRELVRKVFISVRNENGWSPDHTVVVSPPPAPHDLNAENLERRFRLTWTPFEGATYWYQWKLDTVGRPWSDPMLVPEGDDHAIVPPLGSPEILQVGRRYAFRVWGENEFGGGLHAEADAIFGRIGGPERGDSEGGSSEDDSTGDDGAGGDGAGDDGAGDDGAGDDGAGDDGAGDDGAGDDGSQGD